jgi:hypothetical protein
MTSIADIKAIRDGLKALRDRNLDEATFEDKLDIISKLGIKVYPSEDLKSMRVACQLNLEQVQSDRQSGEMDKVDSVTSQGDEERESAIECRKVLFGSPYGIRTLRTSRFYSDGYLLAGKKAKVGMKTSLSYEIGGNICLIARGRYGCLKAPRVLLLTNLVWKTVTRVPMNCRVRALSDA